MKKYFIVIAIIIAISISAEIQKPIFVVSPTTGISSGIRVGAGFVNKYENHVWEMTLNYKKELISHVAGPEITFKLMNSSNLFSVYLQANRFWNLERKKSFLIIKVGGFLIPTLFAIDNNDKVILLITIGYGYSFNIARKFYLRPSIDIGLQPNLINVGLAITF
ncbi:MAG: hypothetical protein K9N07_00545 [Candidatus Cloacimonetes bacterium]|nr:hypothetical protein [Candidatus Cloacimonadota bacterium]